MWMRPLLRCPLMLRGYQRGQQDGVLADQAHQRGGVQFRHSEMANILFLDGHVKAQKETQHIQWDARAN